MNTIDLHGFEISYQITGSYHPATMEDPAEYPEVEVIAIEDEDGEVALSEFEEATGMSLRDVEEWIWREVER